jgi:hypothetical protein
VAASRASRAFGMGSGTIITIALLGVLLVMICLGRTIGWQATWRAIGVTPLDVPFRDMHIIMAYAACASKGLDAYLPSSCFGANFNIPPAWLWLARIGLDESASVWLSVLITAAGTAVIIGLFRARTAG